MLDALIVVEKIVRNEPFVSALIKGERTLMAVRTEEKQTDWWTRDDAP